MQLCWWFDKLDSLQTMRLIFGGKLVTIECMFVCMRLKRILIRWFYIRQLDNLSSFFFIWLVGTFMSILFIRMYNMFREYLCSCSETHPSTSIERTHFSYSYNWSIVKQWEMWAIQTSIANIFYRHRRMSNPIAYISKTDNIQRNYYRPDHSLLFTLTLFLFHIA